MHGAQAVRAEVAQLQAAAILAQQAGKENEAGQLWARVLEYDANHGLALISLGKRAFRYGDLDRAQLAFEPIRACYRYRSCRARASRGSMQSKAPCAWLRTCR